MRPSLRAWIFHVRGALCFTGETEVLSRVVHALHNGAITYDFVVAVFRAWSTPTPRPKRMGIALRCLQRLARQEMACWPIRGPQFPVLDLIAHFLSTLAFAQHAIGARIMLDRQKAGFRVRWLPTMAL